MTMKVRDVMSIRLLCARPDTPLQELARTLVRNRIGGMPVTDDGGRVRGIVSESDLQPLNEGRPGRPLRVASDVMTKPVITLAEGDSITQAARVLRRHRIKRAPVLREGRIVGMIAQSDLLRPFLRTDREIAADVEEAFLEDHVVGEAEVRVTAHEGIVTLEGHAPDRRLAAILVRLARSVDGVIDVRDKLRVSQPVGW